MFENVKNIQQNHELYHEFHGKLEVGIDSGSSKASRDKDPKEHFQGDPLLPLQFLKPMMSHTIILRKWTRFSTSQEKINYLMYMDDIKLSTKSEKEQETLVQIRT